jgi:hypothetical protein
MVAEPTRRATFQTGPLEHVVVLQGNMDSPLSQLQLHPIHVRRRFDPENSTVQFTVLHLWDYRAAAIPLSLPATKPEFPS